MRNTLISFISLASLAGAVLFGLTPTVQATDHQGTGLSEVVDAKGNIKLPDDFRLTMTHLGSWYVPGGDASGFHDVYADTESVSAFRRDGKFPDGAVLVKELRGAESGNFTTGDNVSYSKAGVKQWFVMVKDSQNRFAGNPAWGDGWGWALFKPGDTNTNVGGNYKESCLGCHQPAKDTDWIYLQAYPSLMAR